MTFTEDETGNTTCWPQYDYWDPFAEMAAQKILNDAIRDEKLWNILKLAEQARDMVVILSRVILKIKSVWISQPLIKRKLLFSVSGYLPARIRRIRK